MRNDRRSAYEQHGLALDDALAQELALGMRSLADPAMLAGVARFTGRGGRA